MGRPRLRWPSISHHLPPDFAPTSSISTAPHADTHHGHAYAQDPAFTDLLAETQSIIGSCDFAFVLEACLDRASEIMFMNLKQSVFESATDGASSTEVERMRLADLLPGLARWSALAMRGNPNELVDVSYFLRYPVEFTNGLPGIKNLLMMKEVQCLSGIVFAKFEEKLQG